MINPAFAQQPAAPPVSSQAKDEALEEVVVTGLRASLEASMDIKRDAVGVVDAITAEDMGKFPDTNLAESLQRITGISIDRRNGEGAQVSARGFGPQFNLVTLNGRPIPGADGFGNGEITIGGQGSGTRSFNFAQLASEAISSVEVYKTSRADLSSGGIGATVNIKTARPFDNAGTIFNLGTKGVYDKSSPFDSGITPEVSGIFSMTNDDKTWGVGLSASYQKRHGGSIQFTENAWNIQAWDGTSAALRPGANVENEPDIGQLYGMPNDMRYAFSDFERERINAQGVVQFAPSDALTLTLDYTFAGNDITENRGEQTIWLQRNGSVTDLVFDTGEEVATPVFLRDIVGGKDFGFEHRICGLDPLAALRQRRGGANGIGRTRSALHPRDRARGGLALVHSAATSRRQGLEGELFRVDSWTQVMLGQGITPERYHHYAKAISDQDLTRFLSGLKGSIEQAVARMPSHQEFLDRYCRASDMRSS